MFFTGRNLPNFLAHNLDFVTYSLSELQENDIKSMFISYLGNYHGISCYDFIENSGVKDLLRNPLYTAFVLVLLKDNLSFGKLDIQKVKKIILNKSLLFDDLIIQKFIKLYEADKANIDQELRELYKNKEISILSNMAYHMTYDVGDTEQLEVEVAKKFFEDLGNPILILKEFREHNILKVHGSYISFENKEIRLFFTAKHLIKKIQNYNDFLKFKDKFKNNKPINIFESNRNTWDNIQEFLLGMFQISQVIDTNLFPKKPEMAFLNEKLFDQLKLILNIFEKGYSIHDDSFLNKNYLLKFFRINNIAFKKEKDIGFKSNYWTSIYLILGKLIEKIPIVQKLLPEIVIYRANMDYIDRMSNLDYFWFTTIARRYHLGVNFNDYFQSYKETFIIDDFHTYQFFKGIFKKGGKIEFPEHQINQFVYRFVFNDFNLPDYKAFEELLNSAEKNDKFEFVERYLERGFDNFILFFFNQHKNPNYIRCIKLLYRLKRIGWDFSIKNYSNYPIHIQKNVFDVLFQGAVISKIHRKNFFDKYIFNLIEHIEDEMLKDKLSHEATSFFLSEKSSQDQKLHAFIVVLITDNKKNINTLIGLLDFSKESIFQNLIREKFLELTDKLTHKSKFYKKPSISIIILKLINVYKRETTIENEKILSSFLKKISYSTDKITSEVVLLSTDSNSELYHAILSYFSNNEPTDKKTLNFLINELNNIEYGAWIYNILYNIDIKFFFEFEEKFKKQADSLYLKFFLFYEFPEYGYITYHDIQKVYFICQEESVELFNMILNSNSIPQEKMVKIIGYDFLADIINEKMKKISDYRKNFINKNYPLKG